MSAPRKILTGFFYTIGSGYVARVASVVFTILLRRELGLEPFDEAVFYFVIFLVLANGTETGLGFALLHYQDKVEEFRDTHFTLNVILGAVLLGIASILAVGLYLYDPDTHHWGATVLVALAGLYFFRRVSSTSESLLRKDFEFGRLSLFHGLGTIVALAFALAAAKSGAGIWSFLIGGWSNYSAFSVVYTAFFVTAVLILRPIRRPRLRLDRVWVRKFYDYAKWIWSGWVLQVFVWNFDKLVIGFMLVDGQLGLYENAWWLMQIPTAVLAHIIFTYTNTLYSRYQNERQRLSDFFNRMASLIVRTALPLAALFVIFSVDIVRIVGETWINSAPIIIWLGFFAAIRPLFEEGYGLLFAVGQTRRAAGVMGIQAIAALLLIPTAAMLWGTMGVSLAIGGIALLGLLLLIARLRSVVDAKWGKIYLPPAVGAGVMFGVNRLIEPIVDSSPLGLALHATGLLVAFATTLVILEFRTLRQNVNDALRILRGQDKLASG